jgi:hypothetical protein
VETPASANINNKDNGTRFGGISNADEANSNRGEQDALDANAADLAA